MTRLSKVRHALAMLAALAATVLLSTPAQAQVRRCLVTATSATQTAEYDPFSPTELQVNNVVITFTRSNGPGGAKPSTIDLYVQAATSNANGTQLIPISVVGAGSATGLNQNVFYNNPGPVPNITVPLGNTPAPGVLRWDYSGNNAASDIFVVTFNVKLPPNLDLTASDSLVFNIEYGCNGTGGGPPFSERATAPNAFTLDINVRSALQASYGGAPLDFGEIGDKTNADISASPLTYVTAPTNYVRVQSSGPYEISLTSANNYYMTPGGSATANPLQKVGYNLKFLGVTRIPTNTAAITTICPRAGVGLASEDRLNIQGQLAEGGAGKVVSGNYRDTLTVTIAPKAAATATTSGGECSGLSGQF